MNFDFDKIKNDALNILTNVEYITAFLCGSNSTGLSHNMSDVDVIVLSDSKNIHINSSSIMEMQVVSMTDIEISINDMLKSRFLNCNSQFLIANLYHGIALINYKEFHDLREDIPWKVIINNMVIDRIRGYKFYKKDAYKFYNTLDYNSSRFCLQKSLESLIDAYMFTKKQLIVKEKWRIKWLKLHNIQLFNELISLYTSIWSRKDMSIVTSMFESYCIKINLLIQEGKHE